VKVGSSIQAFFEKASEVFTLSIFTIEADRRPILSSAAKTTGK
jgi:hypothetical protein